jgi:antitoxin component YwqK of YwqJK toxin-antitoxin module
MKGLFKVSLTKNAILLIISSVLIITTSCKPKAPVETAGAGDLKGLELTPIPGSTIQYARQIDSTGRIQIEGYVDGDKKTGQWIEYGLDGDIGLINHYVGGMLEGTAIRMTFRNQVDLKLNYKQNQLDGAWIAYKYGKVIERRNYTQGKLDGLASTYDDRTFKLKQEVQYKNGLQHGYFKYYDENGNVTLEYQYKDGEKISGGIVDQK